MRIAVHIPTSLLYLWVTVGITIATHFCGGEPMSAKVVDGTRGDKACCCGDQEPMDGCCSTSITMLQVSDAHVAVSENLSLHIDQRVIPHWVDCKLPNSPKILPAEVVHPPGPGTPTHILDCSFLI